MLWERPWYYMHVTPDPQSPDALWVSNVILQKSVDGGKSFRPVRTQHPDNHAIWINPENTELMINGDDGGGSVSLNGGKTWSTQRNQPTAELYRVSVDNQFPYRLYGAQQDNSTISVPSRLPPGMASDFEAEYQIGGCESGHIAVDPRNPDRIYAGCFGGSITSFDRKTGATREIIAYPQLQLAQDRGELKYRYQWERTHPHLAPRPGRALPHVPVRPPLARRGAQLAGDQPRPHDGRPRAPGLRGRADHPRRDRRRGVRYGLLLRGIAPHRGCPVGR